MMSKDQVGKKRERGVMVIPGFPVNDGDVKRVLNIIQGSLPKISTATLDLQIIGMDQFAMAEELAFLIKDNLPCKHLILSMEDGLVKVLQRNTCFEAVLELVSMNPYHRILLHRLAEIFKLAHESVGEGGDRHLNLDLNGIFFKMWAFV
ncbi:hypothetical protein AMTRI_Chr09g39370 [Amborella trichopoda]